MRLHLTLTLLVLAAGASIGQEDESYAPEPKTLEWSGNFDAKYTLFHMDPQSPMYKLQLGGGDVSSSYLTHYRLEPYLNAEYRTADISFVLKTHATYLSDGEATADLFEAYGTYSPSMSFTVHAGKRVYTWGKGYAFNPVGFVNPVKDPENPELAQAGLLSAGAEYIKSYTSDALQSLAFNLLVIPPTDIVGGRYGEPGKTDFALKTYLLLWDTDIDLMAYYSKEKPRRIGLDVARNLQENLEVHGELAFSSNVPRYTICNGALCAGRTDNTSYLFGLRYLSESNTTIIAEYYHNGGGLSKAEYEEYQSLLASAVTGASPDAVQQSRGLAETYFRGANLMRDYVYVKVMQPEPFDWLYFTPSAYAIFNVADKSLLLALVLSYKPATNVEFILWPAVLAGGSATEYGGKQVQERVELWMRVYY